MFLLTAFFTRWESCGIGRPFFTWSLLCKTVPWQMFHTSLRILMWTISVIILISTLIFMCLHNVASFCLYVYGRIKQLLKINVLLLSSFHLGTLRVFVNMGVKISKHYSCHSYVSLRSICANSVTLANGQVSCPNMPNFKRPVSRKLLPVERR